MLAIFFLGTLFAGLGFLLGFASHRFSVGSDLLADRIDAVLPQTQCGQCGFPGCRPYALAIAKGEADIDRCPPGGEAGIKALADLLGRAAKSTDRVRGEEKPKGLAIIDESRCIGCSLCLLVCPVDAILGAARSMHTVIASECTGCELCIASCPVDCIRMEVIPLGGPMMGFALPSDTPPIVKSAQCVLVAGRGECPDRPPALPCIRCGACAEVCPMGLLPQQLYWYSRSEQIDHGLAYRLNDCIECGCCDLACPSRIPLVQTFRVAKGQAVSRQRKREQADLARMRFEARKARRERERRDRDEASRSRKIGLDQSAAAEIRQAVERARQKRGENAATGSGPRDGS